MTVEQAIVAIQRAARELAPAELHASAVADGWRIQPKKYGRAVPLADVYPDGDALLTAVLAGDPQAVAVALRALARHDGEAMLAIALALHADAHGTLQY